MGLRSSAIRVIWASRLTQVQLVVLVLGISAQETTAALRVFVGDRQADDASIKVPHLHEVIANDTYVSQTLNHSSAPSSYVCVLAATSSHTPAALTCHYEHRWLDDFGTIIACADRKQKP